MGSGVVAVVVDGGDVLLVRKHGEDQFLFPAGWIEGDENPFQTAVREVLEESGVLAEPSMLVGSRQHPVTRVWLKYVVCSCHGRGILIQDELEIEEARWFSCGDAISILGPLLFDPVRHILSAAEVRHAQ